jgi:TonB family protein
MRLLTASSVLTIFASLGVSQDVPPPSIQIPPDLLPARLLRKVAPVYPPLARAARIQGTVVLSVLINKEGEIGDTKLVSGHPMLAPAAIQAVKQWRYSPAASADKAVDAETIARVNFRLADGPVIRGGPSTFPQLVRVPAGVTQGLLEAKVDPAYPEDAQEKHIEGTVMLNVDIDQEGNVGRVELVSGLPMLASAAMEAVLQWKYRPFVLSGGAVPVETTVEVKFMLPQ